MEAEVCFRRTVIVPTASTLEGKSDTMPEELGIRGMLRTTRQRETTRYLSQVIDAVVPCEGDVGTEASDTEQRHHSCLYPNGDRYDGMFRVAKFCATGPTDFTLARRDGFGIFREVDGSQYEGEWQRGLRHGKGTQRWAASGAEYEGEWREDRRHGYGRHVCTDGRVYCGGWVADREEGRGKLVSADNTAFQGNFAQGLYHGAGTKIWPSGQRYHGEWVSGKEHGRGQLSFPDGSVYRGEFAHGSMQGVGVLRVHNVVYEGEWRENLPHGQGRQWAEDDSADGATTIAPSGRQKKESGGCYDGQWVHGKKCGFGVFSASDGSVYEGEYQDDVKCGMGTLRWPDGQVYTGLFKDGRRHGAGRTEWPSGDVFEGMYANGVKHGLGVLTLANGDIHTGSYEADEPHGAGRYETRDGDCFTGAWQRGQRHGEAKELREGRRTKTVYEHGLLLSVTPVTPGPEMPEGRAEVGWRHAAVAQQHVQDWASVRVKTAEELGLHSSPS